MALNDIPPDVQDLLDSLEAKFDEMGAQLKAKDEEISSLSSELSEAQEEMDKLKTAGEGRDEITRAVEIFIDEIDRPVGQLTFEVPKSPRVDRAILGMHDAIGRRL